MPCYLVFTDDLHHPIVVDASRSDSIKTIQFTPSDIESEVKKKFNGISFRSQQLKSSDGYYMESARNSFPVIKCIIDDQDKTWIYVNPANLKIVQVYNKNTRVRRWLYKGLHSFDFNYLKKHDWLRITILILLSIFGTVISISGLVLSYNYLRRKMK
jgi:hypothetical protein